MTAMHVWLRARMRALNRTPNQLPNSAESVNARQIRSRGARSSTVFSIRSEFMSGLLGLR